MIATERLQRFAGASSLQLGDRFLDLHCVLNARTRPIQGVPTRLLGYEGRFENLSFLDASRALSARAPLRLTLADGSRFRVAVLDAHGSFTAEPVD
ncbi:MAG TPA: hypothetical protein VMT15_15620 [Bryobacteraceae bacterium]|nr:hypothetical protein [Bryobacteraceae bacterium]